MKEEIREMIQSALTSKPIEAQESLSRIMAQKASDAIQSLKVEVASEMFNKKGE